MNHQIAKLPVLVIEAHSRCNCRCVMCDIWKTTDSTEFSLSDLEQQLPAIERLGVEWVVFSGGEPLMHSDLFPLARQLRERNVRVTILSTGLLLERFAEQIAAHIDDVIISLDGPEPIHDQIRRIPGAYRAIAQGLTAIRRHAPRFRVRARCTVQKANHARLAETVEAARHLDLASISFLAADLSSGAFGRAQILPAEQQDSLALTRAEAESLTAVVEDLIAFGDPLIADSPMHLRRIPRHFLAHLGIIEFESPHCNAPWVSAVVEPDGRLRPCFFHPILGSLAQSPLDAALNQPAALNFRERLDIPTNHTCRQCVCSLFLPQPV